MQIESRESFFLAFSQLETGSLQLQTFSAWATCEEKKSICETSYTGVSRYRLQNLNSELQPKCGRFLSVKHRNVIYTPNQPGSCKNAAVYIQALEMWLLPARFVYLRRLEFPVPAVRRPSGRWYPGSSGRTTPGGCCSSRTSGCTWRRPSRCPRHPSSRCQSNPAQLQTQETKSDESDGSHVSKRKWWIFT